MRHTCLQNASPNHVIRLIQTCYLSASSRVTEGVVVVRHLPLVLEVPGLIPARGEENFVVRTRFL